MNFGEKLKVLRTGQGLSQRQLAERLCIAKSVISYYESGDTFNMRLNLNDYNRVAEFVKNQLTSGWLTYGSMFEDAAMPAAGEYTGTVNFIVRLEPLGSN